MRRQFKGSIFTLLALAITLVGMVGASFVFAKGQSHNTAHTGPATSAQPATAHVVIMHRNSLVFLILVAAILRALS